MTASAAAQSATLPLLSVTDLTLRFGERTVLAGIDFTLGTREVLGLLGPNGCGKSTIIALLCGLHRADRGDMRCFGEDALSPGARRHVGVVFQRPSLDPKLTVEQNLLLAAQLWGIVGRDARDRVFEQLDAAEMRPERATRVDKLSGGMKRRVDIARALLHRPKLLLLDEPTAGLDEYSFRQTWKRLEQLRGERHLSILLTTHRPEEAERCDRLAVITAGKVVRTESPEALRREFARDVVTIKADDIETLQRAIETDFDVHCLVDRGQLLIECDAGHQLIPRLVERYPTRRMTSVSLRQPSLADVFLKVTGRGLTEPANV